MWASHALAFAGFVGAVVPIARQIIKFYDRRCLHKERMESLRRKISPWAPPKSGNKE
jgi:hypothetical protein